jgi:hypothetical protein
MRYVYRVAEDELPGGRILVTFARTFLSRGNAPPPAGPFRTFLVVRDDRPGSGRFIPFVGPDGRETMDVDWETEDDAIAGHAAILARLQPH